VFTARTTQARDRGSGNTTTLALMLRSGVS
jgi:hypothetical protein